MNPQAIGEAAITPQTEQAVAPDVSSQQGQSQLFQKAVQANQAKPIFDTLLKKIATKLGGESSTRVKSIETAAAKIAQKRLQGRDYGIPDINDMLGGRIIIKNKDDFSQAKSAIKAAAKQGSFKINEAEPVKQGTYRAFHYDVTLPNGVGAEIQIHTPHSASEAVVNHDLRAVHGEKPESPAVTTLRELQAKLIDKLPGDKAVALSKIVQDLRKQNNNKPIDPRVTAALIKQM